MPEITGTFKEAWAVDIIESERGWGSKVDEVKYFDNFDDAAEFVNKFNSHNIAESAPDWYMVASTPKRVKMIVK